MDLDLFQLNLTAEELAELQEPYGPKHAMLATRIGFAMGLSELGITPSEFETLVKAASFEWSRFLPEIPEAYGTAAMLATGAGALGGAYSGYARARAEQVLNGQEDPEAVALERKLKAYKSLSGDLTRTNSLRRL